MITTDDTICAISTPPGSGGIAVVRLSGPEAFGIGSRVFEAARHNFQLSESKPNTVHFGYIKDGADVVDEVLLTVFRAPHSYTGDHTLEISCHGSLYIQQRIMQLLIRQGARLADAGEYTMRAFLNGKMDLSQAEAVADLINATSAASHRVALQQMRGGFSGEIKELREKLLDFISLLELELDFAEEDVEFANREQLFRLVQTIHQKINELVESFSLGNVIKNGLPVAIVGEPNVGKSTLLNALFNEEKAIVSEIAGTTRDSIEDVLNIEGILFRFIDTAGLRDSNDSIENLGIERTYQKIEQAAIVILLVEAQSRTEKTEATIRRVMDQGKKLLVAFNKIDIHDFAHEITPQSGIETVAISAKKGKNIDALKQKLLELSGAGHIDAGATIVTNARHYEALTKAAESLHRVLEGLNSGISNDFLSQDIREVLYYLGTITGNISVDDVLGNIFAKFCIGK